MPGIHLAAVWPRFAAETQYVRQHHYTPGQMTDPATEPLHPTTGQKLNALERQLWRFRMVGHEASRMWRGLRTAPPDPGGINDDLMFALSNHALVIVCKFLEIWDDLGSLAQGVPRVIPTRRAVQPLVDRLQIWKGLDEFRNTTLAHAYQTKRGTLLPPWTLLRAGLAPTYHAEILLLLQTCVFASLGVLLAFEAEYTPIDPIARAADDSDVPPEPGISRVDEIDGILRPLCAQVSQSLLRDLGIKSTGPLYDTFRRSLGN